MSRQYPVWNIVDGNDYAGDKSYGVRRYDSVDVVIGTSSKNSHHFLRHSVGMLLLDDGSRQFSFMVDGDLIKRAVMRPGAKEIEILVGRPPEDRRAYR